ncbi:MAG: hypothetical protein QM722_00640 [Piscinibacter sp.]
MTQVFRRDLLTWIEARRRGPDVEGAGGPLGHDAWVSFLAQSLGRVVTLAQPLASHRRHGDQVSGHPASMLWRRPRGHALRAGDLLERRRAIALHRAQLLGALAEERPNRPLAAQARIAAVYWRRLGDIHGLRAHVYRGSTFAERRAALNRLLSLGTYRGERAGEFTQGTLARDLTLGLCQLPFGGPVSDRPGPAGPRYGLRDGV